MRPGAGHNVLCTGCPRGQWMVPRGGEEAGAEVPDGGVSLLKTTEAQSRRLEEQSRKAARPTPKPDVLPSPARARDLLEA